VIEIIVLAVAAFIATHIDEALALVAFYTDPRLERVDVFVGQFVGMSAIVAIALALALLSLAIPVRYVGYLGLLPILIGVKSLWFARRPEKDAWCSTTPLDAWGPMSTVALVTLANGGDNVAVYVPLFARHTIPQILLICAIFAAMTSLWLLYGKMLVSRPEIGESIRRWGRMTVPFVLIAIGIFVLLR
jgi:cadmium resistance protein CadD (predicted permease)